MTTRVDPTAIKKKAPRKRKPIDLAGKTEEQLIELSRTAVARRMKERKADVFSKAKPASEKQWNYLGALTGARTRGELVRFVEFANQIPSGHGTLDIYDRRRVFLSTIYFIRGIEMALHGQNDLCRAEDEYAISCGFNDVFEMIKDQIGI